MNNLTERLTKEFADKDYAHAYMNAHQSTRLATQIKVLREQRGLTQGQLAELSGMKQTRISALEDVDYDAWTISTLRKLAYAMDTTLNISFAPFSKGIEDIIHFSRQHLQVESREKDLVNFMVYKTCNETAGKINKYTFNFMNDQEKYNTTFYKTNEATANDDQYQNAA